MKATPINKTITFRTKDIIGLSVRHIRVFDYNNLCYGVNSNADGKPQTTNKIKFIPCELTKVFNPKLYV